MKEVFISYASEQIAIAKQICDLIEKDGISAFVAERDIPVGTEYAAEIVKAIDHAKAMVLVLSKEANDSPHVLREVERAVGHNTPILVYAVEDVELNDSMAYFLMTNQWLRNSANRDQLLLTGLHSLTGDATGAVPVHEPVQPQKKSKRGLFIALGIVAVLAIGAAVAAVVWANNRNSAPEETTAQPTAAQTDAQTVAPATEENTADVTTTAGEETTAEKGTVAKTDYELGATFVMGTYLDEPITWRLIHYNEDGTAVLIAQNILTIKAYDTAECGSHNDLNGVDYWSYENTFVTDQELLIQIRGNNEWSKSNIRTWLNSDKEMVTYADQAPTKQASVLHENGYSEEPGFLYGFTAEEKAALVVTSRKSEGNVFSEVDADGNVTSEEAVFLLSKNELEWFTDAGISVYGKPTEKALDQDETSVRGILEDYKTDTYLWWLRDPGWDYRIGKEFPDDPELKDGFASANIGTVVSWDESKDVVYTNRDTSVCVSYGIRPAMTVDLSKLPQE